MNYSFTVGLFLQGIYFLGGFSGDFFRWSFLLGDIFPGFFSGGFLPVPAPDISLFLRKLYVGQNELAIYIVLTSFSGL